MVTRADVSQRDLRTFDRIVAELLGSRVISKGQFNKSVYDSEFKPMFSNEGSIPALRLLGYMLDSYLENNTIPEDAELAEFIRRKARGRAKPIREFVDELEDIIFQDVDVRTDEGLKAELMDITIGLARRGREEVKGSRFEARPAQTLQMGIDSGRYKDFENKKI